MTNERALEFLKSARETRKDCAIAAAVYNIAIEAVEKQIAKKVIMRDCCPTCGSKGITETGDPYIDYQLCYCNNCGQRLKWEEKRQ